MEKLSIFLSHSHKDIEKIIDGDWSHYVSSKVLNWFDRNENLDIVPVNVDDSFSSRTAIPWDSSDDCLMKIITAVQTLSRS